MFEYHILIVLSLFLSAQATPTGNHTCTGVVKHEVTVQVNVTEPVTFRAYEWCLRVPPRCSTYTIQLKDRVKTYKEMHNRTITVCCKGYVEIDYKCVPACPPDTECPNMHCNRTNHCYCTPGYTGLYCNHPCPKGVWGAGCIKLCDCPAGYTCHHLTGDCMIDDNPPSKTRRTTIAAHASLITTQPTSTATTQLLTTTTTYATQPPTTTTTTLPPTTTTTTLTPTTPTTTTTTLPPSTTTTTTLPPSTTSTTTLPPTTTTTTIPPTTTTLPPTTAAYPSTTTITTTLLPTTTTYYPSTTTSPTYPPSTRTTSTYASSPKTTTPYYSITSTTTTYPPTTTTSSTTIPSTTTKSSSLENKSEVDLSPTSITIAPDTTATIRETRISTEQTELTTNRWMISRSETPTTRAPATSPTTTQTASTQSTTTNTTASTSSEEASIPDIPSSTSTIAPRSDTISWTSPVPEKVATKEPATTPENIVTVFKTDSIQITSQTAPTSLEGRETSSLTYEIPHTVESAVYEGKETTHEPSTYAPSTFYTIKTTTTEKQPPSDIPKSTRGSQTSADLITTTEQVTIHLVNTSSTQKKPLDETAQVVHWADVEKDTSNNKTYTKLEVHVNDKWQTQTTEKPTTIIDSPTTITTVTPVDEDIGKFIGQQTGGRNHVVTEETAESSTTNKLDRMIIEDVPKAPTVKETTVENPIHIVEEVINKYFPDTFMRATIGKNNESDIYRKEGKDFKLSLPPRKSDEGQSAIWEVDKMKATPSSTTQQSPSTSSPTMETTTVAIITPKVIVSAKNPDEIDLGGVIYRKMKLFPPIKPATESSPEPTTIGPSVTWSKGVSISTPIGDRFKIYLPEYEKQSEDIETTETPSIKTFIPKFNFEKEEFDYGKQAQAKKAKQKEKDLKKYKFKPHEVSSEPAEDVSKERVTNNVFLETKEFKVHLASTKSQKFGEYTKAPLDQDSSIYDLNKLAKKKGMFGSSDHEPSWHVKQTVPVEGQNVEDVGITQSFTDRNPTTNDKPPHTWYSHAREKAKIKSALKVMKSTLTLDMNMKPTVDSMMEESNDINSLATLYTDREPRAVTYQEDINNPQMFGQIKFNAPEGYAAAVSRNGTTEGGRLGILTSVAVGAACFIAMASLVAVLWLRLKTKRSQMRKTETMRGFEERPAPIASNYETVYPIHRVSDELEVATFFCPTFTNDCAERINRELKESSYDHPRYSFGEPLYAEVLHPKIRSIDD